MNNEESGTKQNEVEVVGRVRSCRAWGSPLEFLFLPEDDVKISQGRK